MQQTYLLRCSLNILMGMPGRGWGLGLGRKQFARLLLLMRELWNWSWMMPQHSTGSGCFTMRLVIYKEAIEALEKSIATSSSNECERRRLERDRRGKDAVTSDLPNAIRAN